MKGSRMAKSLISKISNQEELIEDEEGTLYDIASKSGDNDDGARSLMAERKAKLRKGRSYMKRRTKSGNTSANAIQSARKAYAKKTPRPANYAAVASRMASMNTGCKTC